MQITGEAPRQRGFVICVIDADPTLAYPQRRFQTLERVPHDLLVKRLRRVRAVGLGPAVLPHIERQRLGGGQESDRLDRAQQ